jgi:hypothetical protein
MTGAARLRTAWTDPEHMRLQAFRSWWDENSAGPAERGPLPPGQDLWSIPGPPVPSAAPCGTGGP